MGHILENLVGTIFNPATLATGYRALDSLSPSVLASFWESTQAATALVERARAESLPAGDEPGAAQAKQCEELLQFALGILRYTLDLAATPKQKLANDLSASGIEPRLHDVLMRNLLPGNIAPTAEGAPVQLRDPALAG